MSLSVKARRFGLRLLRLADQLEKFEKGELSKADLNEHVRVLYDAISGDFVAAKAELDALVK